MTTTELTVTADADAAAAPPADMRRAVSAHDWAATPLGPRAAWSETLRTIVDMMLDAGHAMCLMWGPERTFLYNDLYAPMLASRHPAALGEPVVDVWPELYPDIAPLIDRTFAGETVTRHDMPLTMTRNGFAEQTWWDFAYSPVRAADGTVLGLLNVTADATARVAAERERDAVGTELRENEAFMASVLAASTDCIKVLELDGTLSFMSDGGMQAMEIADFAAVRARAWPDFLDAAGAQAAHDALAAARAGRTTHFEAPARTYLGSPRYWSISVSPIADRDGVVQRILAVSRDHSELHRGRERQALLNDELAHRIKNMMSVVQAIAFQTLGKLGDSDAVRAFEERLAALARSHDVLTAQRWSAMPIDDLARSALATFGTDRCTVAGPAITIGPRAALALSLMLHELGTNAVKYGALGAAGGSVLVDWRVRDAGAEPQLEFDWIERGGPPASAPTRKGFGSRIIRMGLIGAGGVELDYGTDGLSMKATAPLHQVQEA